MQFFEVHEIEECIPFQTALIVTRRNNRNLTQDLPSSCERVNPKPLFHRCRSNVDAPNVAEVQTIGVASSIFDLLAQSPRRTQFGVFV
jgi:hypothetical protein